MFTGSLVLLGVPKVVVLSPSMIHSSPTLMPCSRTLRRYLRAMKPQGDHSPCRQNGSARERRWQLTGIDESTPGRGKDAHEEEEEGGEGNETGEVNRAAKAMDRRLYGPFCLAATW